MIDGMKIKILYLTENEMRFEIKNNKNLYNTEHFLENVCCEYFMISPYYLYKSNMIIFQYKNKIKVLKKIPYDKLIKRNDIMLIDQFIKYFKFNIVDYIKLLTNSGKIIEV